MAASCVALSLSSVGFAGVKEPPPKGGEGCSQGFFKKHLDWQSIPACCTGAQCNELLEQLNAKGRGSGAIRAGATAALNACWPEAPCDDD